MRAPRSVRTLILVGLGCAAVVPAALLSAPRAALANSPDDLEVGTQLTAVTDVRLHRAVIAKGSKVSVFHLSRKRGQVDAVDVQLADGHVVREVAISTIRLSFRVADE